MWCGRAQVQHQQLIFLTLRQNKHSSQPQLVLWMTTPAMVMETVVTVTVTVMEGMEPVVRSLTRPWRSHGVPGDTCPSPSSRRSMCSL